MRRLRGALPYDNFPATQNASCPEPLTVLPGKINTQNSTSENGEHTFYFAVSLCREFKR
jgi:hypothetical protein